MHITDLLIHKLNHEIRYWQEKALTASQAGNADDCQAALNSQAHAIQALIALIESNRPDIQKV